MNKDIAIAELIEREDERRRQQRITATFMSDEELQKIIQGN